MSSWFCLLTTNGPHIFTQKKKGKKCCGPGPSSQRPSSVSNRNIYENDSPKLCHCLFYYFSFVKKKEIIAEMLMRIVSTAPTKRNSHDAINSGFRPRLTQQRDDDYYTSNGDATNRFHLVFRKLQTNFQWYNSVHRKPIKLFYGRCYFFNFLGEIPTTCRVIGRPVIFFFWQNLKKKSKEMASNLIQFETPIHQKNENSVDYIGQISFAAGWSPLKMNYSQTFA